MSDTAHNYGFYVYSKFTIHIMSDTAYNYGFYVYSKLKAKN